MSEQITKLNSKLARFYPEHVATLVTRHSEALVAHNFDALVVHSGSPLMQYLDDNTYPFKANPHFKSWVPLTAVPDSFVVFVPGKKPVLVYFQPDDYWHKTPDAPEGYWTEQFDVQVISDKASAKKWMPKGHVAFIGEWQERFEKWTKFTPNPQPLVHQLHYARAWKTPYELVCMEHASYLGALGHRAAYLAFMEETSEYDIHLAYCAACELTDEQLPYSNIIALNQHSAILHYTYRDTQIVPTAERRSFLIDAGASCLGYASDITRSYAWEDDGLYGELIDQMDELQRVICEQMRPGVHYPDVHLDTHRAIGGILHNAGIIKTNGDEAAESGLTGTFYPHGLGHYIGLQVHDVGGFMKDASGEHVAPPEGHEFLRLTRTLDTHQVMTIEPGIYWIPSLLGRLKDSNLKKQVNWDVVESLIPYGGIRIEDNVVVTNDAPINLTRDAFDKIEHVH